ncbi:hypothetical protein [Paraburkholderia acidiphila]|uniref:Uncharacterized protein n=1 Tax=Paraburkholderia acidiphila TaxID=2571747 RepID=A0A7Z2GDC6_9BURK|nr:hypothetical protein [Paraburkholderia acidiphila]QGZ59673.1 hypothetical protein FAZ97_32380 [Paraburkholderia acidiphila]
MPEFTGDYKSATKSVKNNIWKGFAGSIKKMRGAADIQAWIETGNGRALPPELPVVCKWKGPVRI